MPPIVDKTDSMLQPYVDFALEEGFRTLHLGGFDHTGNREEAMRDFRRAVLVTIKKIPDGINGGPVLYPSTIAAYMEREAKR